MCNLFFKILSFFRHGKWEDDTAGSRIQSDRKPERPKKEYVQKADVAENNEKVHERKSPDRQKRNQEFDIYYNRYAVEAEYQRKNKRIIQANTNDMSGSNMNIYHEQKKNSVDETAIGVHAVLHTRSDDPVKKAAAGKENESPTVSVAKTDTTVNETADKVRVVATSERKSDHITNSTKNSARSGSIQKIANSSSNGGKSDSSARNAISAGTDPVVPPKQKNAPAGKGSIQKIGNSSSNGGKSDSSAKNAIPTGTNPVAPPKQKNAPAGKGSIQKIDVSLDEKKSVSVVDRNIKMNTVGAGSHMIDRMRQFRLDENVSIVKVDNTIKSMLEYFDELKDALNHVIDYVAKNNKVKDFDRIEICLKNYKKKLLKLCDRLGSKIKSDDPDISEEVTVSIFSLTDTDLLKMVMKDVYCNVLNSGDVSYIALLNKLNVFLEVLGIYTYGKKIAGDYIEDDDCQFYDIAMLRVSDKKLFGKIKSIGLYPYMVNYYNYNGIVKYCFCLGSIIVYGKE